MAWTTFFHLVCSPATYVRIWSVVRPAADITRDYQTELLGARPGLLANWRFDELTRSVTPDSSGNNHAASLAGGALLSPDVHP